jgi:negative regulator of sigma F NrsF-like protein
VPAESPEELIAALSERLQPVRPVTALRWQISTVLAVCAATAWAVAAWLGLHPIGVVERGAISASLAGALALAGLSSLTLALAARVPGRESLVRASASGAALALAIAAGLCVALRDSVHDFGTPEQLLRCASSALLSAVPVALCASGWAMRGAPWRARSTGFAISIGAAAIGGLLIHFSCPSPMPGHWLLAHALAPLAVGACVGWLLSGLLTRARARPTD